MPEFDKSTYWERRKKHLRGQEYDATIHKTLLTDKGPVKIPMSGRVTKTSSRKSGKASTKAVDRKVTKKGYTGHKVNPPAKNNWFYPAEMTNAERNEWRRDRRIKLKEQADAKAKTT